MTCPTCFHPFDLLVCPVCTRARSDRAIREYQYAPLRKILARLGKLTVRAVERTGHLQMFGTKQTYCGIELSPGHRTSWVEYDPAKLRNVCPKCRAVLDGIVDEVRRKA